jgi:pyruvate kinase
MGYPHIKWTPELEQSVVDWISSGQTLREFGRQPGNPSHDAVYAHEDLSPDFKQRIARARLDGEEAIAQDCLQIADTTQLGEIVTLKADGSEERKIADMIEHRKLKIDTRLKLLAKWNPRKWGDRSSVELTVDTLADRLRQAEQAIKE